MLQRANVLELQKEIWFAPIEGSDFEVAILPVGAWATTQLFSNAQDEAARRRFATEAFVNFRNYMDGDAAVPNTITARLELLTVDAVREAMIVKVRTLNESIALGESEGDSD